MTDAIQLLDTIATLCEENAILREKAVEYEHAKQIIAAMITTCGGEISVPIKPLALSFADSDITREYEDQKTFSRVYRLEHVDNNPATKE